MHWISQYVGKKWVSGARGPETFDCWGLVFWVYKKHFGISLPEYPGVDPTDTSKVSHLLRNAAGSGQWARLEKPVDGCAVAMSRNREFHHVGVFVEVDGGLIVHAADGLNVVAQSVFAVKRAGFIRIEFFKHGAHNPNNTPV